MAGHGESRNQPSAWLGYNHEHNCWGIEWDLPETIDGHFAVVCPHKDPNKSLEICERILEAMRGSGMQFKR